VVNASGNVGIGTTTPTNPLSVVGNANITGNTTLGSSGLNTAAINGNITATGNLTVDGDTTLGAFSSNTSLIRGNVTLGSFGSSTLTINGTAVSTPNGLNFDSNTLYIDALNNRVGIGTITPTNPLSVTGNANITGNTTLGDASGDTLTINGNSVSIPNNLNFDSNTLYIDATNNRVGVGTSGPTVPLDVLGAARITGNTTFGDTSINTLTINGTAVSTPNGLNFDSNTFVIDALNNRIGIGVASPTSLLELKAGTSSVAPLEFTAGTNLITPVAGTVEYDGVVFYTTNDVTTKRGLLPSCQIFRLNFTGSAIGPGIANFFGSSSAVQTDASGIYELEAYLRFTKTTAGTVTITLSNSVTPNNISGTVQYGAAVGGTATGAANQITLNNSTLADAAFGASASLSTGVNHTFIVRALIETKIGGAGNFRINITSSAGTVTPLQTSYYKLTKLPAGNVGSFVA
jgi:hypothetical protein